MTARVLVVDDDVGVRYTIAEILREIPVEVELAEDGEQALEMTRRSSFELVITDLRMAPMDGLELLAHLRAEQPALKVVLITAHGSERAAVQAMRLGAYDYFRKPFEVDELVAVVERALESIRLARENERLAGERDLSQHLVFGSRTMSQLGMLVRRVAPRDVTVLLTGESGTGKERVAEAIVQASLRAEAPFVRFNCAAIAPELAEAELFGHTRGAFTGARGARKGLFRVAHGGTLLLDEIGELDAGLQAKLLRVLQQGEVRPVGEDRSEMVDVRLIVATHRHLPDLVASGSFREDLYYRLRVVELRVPPLRERPEDIPVLARHFLRRFAERFGTGPLRITSGLMDELLARTWPGNVRELENALEALVALSVEGELDVSLLPGPSAVAEGGRELTLKQRVEAYERGIIVNALESAGGNQRETARRLGISRATLQDKLSKYELRSRDK
jgi:DNA-binding NtrC family response regulator